MAFESVIKTFEGFLLSKLGRISPLQRYIKTYGWPFLIAWFHRISGIVLVFYLWLHLYTLNLLLDPDVFDAKMKFFRLFIFVFLEWLLAIPVIYHALNGGRLILYEFFGHRNEAAIIRWTTGLSAVYVLLMGFMMMMGNQTVSPIFYWLGILVFSLSLCGLAVSRIWNSRNSAAWKLQRISGAFLLIMIPAHLLVMHLQPLIGHDAGQIISRLQNVFIKTINVSMLVAAFYHGSYGLFSMSKDYISSKAVQLMLAVPLLIITIWFVWIGIRLMFSV
ncbi:hypothetical protein ACFLZL_02655 [Thermodesulfobacteriota bacterium]